jgi:amidohydrolase
MKNVELAKKYEQYIIDMRRYFHENPELPTKEYNTVKRILEELEAMGIECFEVKDGGVVGIIRGEKDNGRAVLLRADMDALAVQETDENLKCKRVCKSKVDGVMHACGHDGHTAMLLGAARILLEKRSEIEGTVYLCFERGEEGGGNVRYLLKYFDDNKIHIDSAYGIHLFAAHDIPNGAVAINDGSVMASLMLFNVTIVGRGGHGSRPDLASSPIDAFVAIYNNLQAMRVTKIPPKAVLTYSLGKVQSGDTHNVIPHTLNFVGTMRTFDREGAGMIFYNEFKKIIDNVCETYDCTPIYNKYTLPGLNVVNDTECAHFARRVIGEELGEKCIQVDARMGSESFAMYLPMWPGVFAFIGVTNEEKGVGADHHNPYFDLDEDVLYKGSASAATYAIEFLKSDVDTSARKIKGGFRTVLEMGGKTDFLEELYGE